MYLRGAVTVAAVVLPLILLYKLWLRRRNNSAGDDPNNNLNSTTTSERADSTTSLASSSSDNTDSDLATSLPIGEYEVFLSFRGPDTRDRITDILYRFLLHLKIHTFKDDDELRKGEGIWSDLVGAIHQSKIYVPILSENYAHSKWCLRELAEIVRHSHEPEPNDRRPLILPIFYKVDPRDVRHQTGSYKEAFEQHEKNFDERIIKEWKDALNEVGSLKGWHVKSDNEQGKYADLVLDTIWSHLRRLYDAVETDELVAIDGHVEDVMKKLSLDSKGMTMVGLHGIGGIGKTTLAKAVYNKVLPQFERCSFLENIRDTQQQKDGILKIQKKLIEDVMRKEESVIDVSKGRRLIADRVSRFKILIVLDDIDEKFKFEEILGDPRSFLPGSRFIITSRNRKLLSTLNEDRCKLHDVQALSPHHSLQLFSKHAFKKDSPSPDYEILSKQIVSTTGGLPLTLKVVGSLLYREGKSIWKEKLMQLREMPERDVMDRLKISYDALEYEAREIFLDIACFYIGVKKEMPFYMWSDCRFYPTNNINLLIQRSMIKIGDDNKFQMHDQLRDMGREIVRRENIEHPWMRSRIWTWETAWELLHGKKGTDQVKAIRLVKPSLEIESQENLEFFLEAEEVVELESECFVNLSELRYFEAPRIKLVGDFDNLLPNLRWLRLLHYQGSGDALINFHMKNLVILELRNSEIDNDWEGWTQIKMANKLKVLDFHDCCNLTKLPKWPESGSLEVLDIGDCEDLGQVLVDVHKLQSLQILRTISTNPQVLMGKLPTCLKELSTSSPINNLSELIELERLEVEHCGYGLEIPPAEDDNDKYWWKLSKLEILKLDNVSKMWSANPNNSRLPSSLTSLVVERCAELEWLPDLENLENLTVLDVKHCLMPREIQGLGGLRALQTLKISFAANLRQLDKGLNNLPCLSSLELKECAALERLSTLESMTSLQTLCIQKCPLLTDIEGIGGLASLQELKIDSAKSLTRIKGLGNLLSSSSTKLNSLTISDCPRLTSLSLCQQYQLHDDDDGNGGGPIGTRGVVNSLETIKIQGCTSLLLLQDGLQLPHLSKFPMLKRLILQDANVLQVKKAITTVKQEEEEVSSLEGLECLEELVEMELDNLPSMERLPSLSKLGNLKYLIIKDMPRLQEIEGLAGLKSLHSLHLIGCTWLERVDGLSGLEELQTVKIQGCTKLLEKLPSLIPNLRKLCDLSIMDMPSLREIDDSFGLANLKSLECLDLTGCSSLERLTVNLPSGLEILDVMGCTNLANLSQLRDCLPGTFIIEDEVSDDDDDDDDDDDGDLSEADSDDSF